MVIHCKNCRWEVIQDEEGWLHKETGLVLCKTTMAEPDVNDLYEERQSVN